MAGVQVPGKIGDLAPAPVHRPGDGKGGGLADCARLGEVALDYILEGREIAAREAPLLPQTDAIGTRARDREDGLGATDIANQHMHGVTPEVMVPAARGFSAATRHKS